MGLSTPTRQRMAGLLGSYVMEEIDASLSSMGGAVVHLDGPETIKGPKTFVASIGVNGVAYDWPTKSADGVLTNDGKGKLSWSILAGVGTVTSVGLRMPPEFIVSGAPIKFSGDFMVEKAPQPACTFFAGPTFGVKAAPSFRRLAIEDVPRLPVEHIAGLETALNIRATVTDLADIRKGVDELIPVLGSKASAQDVQVSLDKKADAAELSEGLTGLKRGLSRKAEQESLQQLERRLEAALAALRGELDDRLTVKASVAGATFHGTLTTTDVVIEDGSNVSLGANRGTRWGTSRGQKQGFYGSIPVSQPSGDIITALANLGLVKEPTIWITDIVGLSDRLAAIEQKLGG